MSHRIYRNESDIIKAVQASYWRVGAMASMVSCVAMVTTAVMVVARGQHFFGQLSVVVPAVVGALVWLIVFGSGCVLLYYAIGQAAFVVQSGRPTEKLPSKPTPPTPTSKTSGRFIPVYRNGETVYLKMGEGGKLHESDE